MSILVAILALSFLIVVHEFGHFIVAKLSGIKVLDFSLFMGPKLFSFRKGETLYSIRLIPLGGYVRMEGEEQKSDDLRAYNNKPVLVRAAVIAAGPVMNIITAIILITIITSVAGYSTNEVDFVAPTTAAAEARIQAGDRIVSYDNKKVYHPNDIGLFVYGTKGKPVNVEIERNNEKRTVVVKPETIPAERYILGFGPQKGYGEGSNAVKTVQEDSDAFKAGLKPGDVITRLNDMPIENNRQIRDFMAVNKGNAVNVTIDRGGEEEVLKITPIVTKGQEMYEVGMDFKSTKSGLVSTVKNSAIYAYALSRNVYYSLAWLVTGKVSLDQMSGPVGIVNAIGDVVEMSPTLSDRILNLLNVVAFISINLGLFNLIPFPALDGSKLILLAVEGIRRKAIPPEKEAFISLIGLVLLVMLMIFATYNDILRLSGG